MHGLETYPETSPLAEICRAGMSTQAYLDLLERESYRIPTPEMDERTRNRVAALPINYQRTNRILRSETVPVDLRSRIGALKGPQVWMILTEPWCGDSAQCIPYFIKFAECNPGIELCFLLRDRNLPVMDRYLTGGTRGIPKIVAFDDGGRELFRWGPRPRIGQDLFLKGKAEGLSRDENLLRLHLWYARNRGEAIVDELREILAAPGLGGGSQTGSVDPGV